VLYRLGDARAIRNAARERVVTAASAMADAGDAEAGGAGRDPRGDAGDAQWRRAAGGP
jgi:hypothetical protein